MRVLMTQSLIKRSFAPSNNLLLYKRIGNSTPYCYSSPHIHITPSPLIQIRTATDRVPSQPIPTPRRILYYTREEVAKHNSQEDCWIIIHGKVYNITSWLGQHPGGAIIMTNAGGDSTQLFESMGHTPVAREVMKDYLIGQLDGEQERKTRNDQSERNLPDPESLMNV